MLLKTIRMPQSKAIHCYLLMTAWIFLIIIGIYKFIEPKEKLVEPILETTYTWNRLNVDVKTKRIFRICNFPEDISPGSEGNLPNQKWVLRGLLVLIRHGDRGPLQHVKKISSINCNSKNTDLLTSYKAYLVNQTLSGKVTWAGPGPFHGFSFLPSHSTQCQLGQLTMKGISQLLTLGSILKSSYAGIWEKITTLNVEDLVVYSTRYRRTFQSALALLFGLIPRETLSKINLYESQSMSFCFRDCGCPVTDKLWKNVKKKMTQQLRSHPAIEILAENTGKYLFSSNAEQGVLSKDPHSVRDALLSFVCHKNSLPCDTPAGCVRSQDVVRIFAYTEWVNYQKWRNIHWRRYCLLKSYGLIRHIVQQMLHMISGNGPSLVLYSGHDHTLEQLTSALGLRHDSLLLRYAARVIFEIYQENRTANQAEGIYFRLLANGKDVTKQIGFCKNLVKVDSKTSLCKMEDIVRFLHDDYFTSLNVTNFKDACIHKSI
nr:unnamed protein product [Callosobruchus chinensis]CAH7764242.1 unnamed protein product [Callosobruchus chinensis]